MTTMSFKDYLCNYIDGPIDVTIIIKGDLPDGEQVDIEMSPEFIPAFKKLFLEEKERVIQCLELESLLED